MLRRFSQHMGRGWLVGLAVLGIALLCASNADACRRGGRCGGYSCGWSYCGPYYSHCCTPVYYYHCQPVYVVPVKPAPKPPDGKKPGTPGGTPSEEEASQGTTPPPQNEVVYQIIYYNGVPYLVPFRQE